MIFVFLLAFAGLTIYGVFGPVVRAGDLFRNNAFWVERGKRHSGNWPPAVMTQERGEWRFAHFVGTVLAAPVFFIAAAAGAALVASVLFYVMGAFAVSALTRLWPAFDYGGHGAEIIEAELVGVVTIKGPKPGTDRSFVPTGAVRLKDYYEAEPGDYVSYRQGEIERMIHLDGRENMTPLEVSAKLDRWHWLARIMHRIS